MKIALVGADGQLGSDLFKRLEETHEVHAWTYPEVDVLHPQELAARCRELRPDLIINTAAYNKVDEAEEDPGAAFALNAFAVRDLAIICRDTDTSLMHFSSDYVFDGFRRIPYSEEDMPRPLSVYGVSKLAGEFFVRSILSQYFLIRTCGLFGTAGCWGKGYNFVDTMVRLAREKQPIRVVNDQYVTPTSTLELAMRLADLIESGEHGLYHMTNTGECSWYEFAAEIFNLMGVETDLEGVDSETFGARAQRPAFSVLDNRHAEELGLPGFSPWTAALKDYLQRKGHLKL